jgi:hypothetical protein
MVNTPRPYFGAEDNELKHQKPSLPTPLILLGTSLSLEAQPKKVNF